MGDVGDIIVEALGGTKSARILFRGKIAEVDRQVVKGHTVGNVKIIPLLSSEQEESGGTVSQGTLSSKATQLSTKSSPIQE
jgi:DUF917 family protein